MNHKLILIALLLTILIGCDNETYTPKPKGYFRIDLPTKEYKSFEKECPFTFEIPKYSSIKQNVNHPDKPCWFDVVFNSLNASIYLSYKPVDNNLNQYL